MQGRGQPGEPGHSGVGQAGGAGGRGGTGGSGQVTGGTGGPGGDGGPGGGERPKIDSIRGYWMARGVIPRWQLMFVYLAIVAAGAVGFQRTADASDEAKRAAAESRQVAARADAALCALRRDLEQRVSAGERFLATHPDGIAGIPAATIRTTLQGQQRTINALAVLRC